MRVTVIIDSNHNDRTIPDAGQRVRVKARDGVFVVLRVNRDAGTADLLRCNRGLRPVNLDVPLNLISPACDYLPELFRWYVEAPAWGADGTTG
jgi:hypothetical protein